MNEPKLTREQILKLMADAMSANATTSEVADYQNAYMRKARRMSKAELLDIAISAGWCEVFEQA